MYAVAFINRTNIALALPSMSRDLHMSSVQAGTIAGIFFWQRMLFGFMFRNAVRAPDRFDLPTDKFLEVGRQVGL